MCVHGVHLSESTSTRTATRPPAEFRSIEPTVQPYYHTHSFPQITTPTAHTHTHITHPSTNNSSPFLLAAGGDKGLLALWNLHEVDAVTRRFDAANAAKVGRSVCWIWWVV